MPLRRWWFATNAPVLRGARKSWPPQSTTQAGLLILKRAGMLARLEMIRSRLPGRGREKKMEIENYSISTKMIFSSIKDSPSESLPWRAHNMQPGGLAAGRKGGWGVESQRATGTNYQTNVPNVHTEP